MKKRETMTNSKNLLKSLTALSALLIVGCAKEKPYDIQYKEVKLLEKSNIVTEETITMKNGEVVTKPVEYLYVPMTLGTPMNVTDADPFYQGQEKVVRLAWSEEGLEVLEIERDARFQDNDLNEYPVLTIPGDYKAFRCQEDAYGDCTHKEEENNELEWYQKTSFLPKFEDIKEREINELDIFTLNDGSCLSEEAKKVVDYEMTQGVINVELETTYKVNKGNFFCFFRSFYDDQLNTNGFRVRQFYSLVRLDSIASKDYEPVAYPEPDHDSFGFFAREEQVLNGDFDRSRKEKKILMERWNPKRENNELVYHLSPEFSKPENKFILDATIEAVDVMNKEMASVNVPFQIVLKEQPDPTKAVSVGDLRYTSLVLIEDPLANGLLGYGPAVSNPYTGEILKAHTNMYLGVLKSQTRWIYQAAVDLTEEKYNEANPTEGLAPGTITVDPNAITNLPKGLAISNFPNLVQQNFAEYMASLQQDEGDDQGEDEETDGPTTETDPEEDQGPTVATEGETDEDQDNDDQTEGKKVTDLRRLNEKARHIGHSHGLAQFDESKLHGTTAQRINTLLEQRIHKKNNLKASILLKKLKEDGELTQEMEELLKEEARLDRYAENNALAVEFFPIGGTSKVIYPELLAISGIQTEKGTLKKWDDLSDAQKEAAQKVIVRSSYKATLIHELGHNLGLRHNFMGSWDKDNFYTDEEARELGMEAAPAYSSIMDYSFSEFNQLKAFGKYDLAALRFGYAREVEVVEGDQVKVEKITGTMTEFEENLPSGVERKPYEFCTDENAGLSSICNRFDEGTSLVEVTKHLIERYKNNYKYRNFRDGRLDFSAYDLPGYIFARKREFTRIRDVLEEYEFFVGIFGQGLMSEGCSPQQEAQFPVCRMIRDRIDSVAVAGEFFIETLLVPDHTCALALPTNDKVVVEYRKLSEIYDGIKFNIDHVTTSCFDEAVSEALANPGQGERALKVVGEVGKFLNGFKDTDPNYKYVTDRFVLGVWPDKVMAMDALFKRTWGKSNTDRGHMSLMDIPAIRSRALPIVEHFVRGRPLELFLPFKTADNKSFVAPYAIGTDYTINPVEDAFSWLRDYLGLPREGGQADFATVALKQTSTGVDFGVEYEEAAFETRNLTAIIKTPGFVAEQNRNPDEVHFFDSKTRVTYSANEYTPIARMMLVAITKFDLLEEAGRELVVAVLGRRAGKPAAPAMLSEFERLFWENVEVETMDILINISRQGGGLNEQVVMQNFGPVVGQAIMEVYAKGTQAMVNIKEAIIELQNTPRDGATEVEKELFNIDLQILSQYATGVLDQEVVDYQIKQIRKMPNFLNAPIR
jgi:hypothetical protein